MKQYSEELKKQVVSEYMRGVKKTADILSPHSIPKSNLYRWVKQYGPHGSVSPMTEFNYRNFYQQGLTIERLNAVINILKRVECTVDSPLSVKLTELEKLYGEYPVHTLCDALEVSRGTFYNHIKRNKRGNTYYTERREKLKEQILQIDEENSHLFGAAKITAVLKEQGAHVTVEFVRKMMRELGLQIVRYKTKSTYEMEEEHRTNNYLNQNFHTDSPNKIWAGDVTYFRFKGKEYRICVILDLFSRKVIAWKIGSQDNTHLTKTTFLIAWKNRQPSSGLLFHSDQGANYRSFTYRKCLAEHGVRQSFSRPRTPQDNAPMESFFASFKREELYRIRYRSVRDFFSSVDRYMTWYNNKRLHQNLHYKTPDAYEETFYAKEQLILSAE